jgi:glucose-1-phosphatase
LKLKKNTKNMKNLILDFGGIIYRISHQKQQKAFADYGVKHFDKLYSQALQSPFFANLERGKVTEEGFKNEVRTMIGQQISDSEIDHLWNSILVGFSDEAVRLLERLRHSYNLFLLSNTNILHYKIFTKEFIELYGYDFNTLFSKAYWSFKMGMRKPDNEIFRYIMEENDLSYEDSVFIDDTEANILAAEDAGLKSVLLSNDKTLSDLFREDLTLIEL